MRVIRYVVLLLLVVFIISAMTFFNQEITSSNFRYLMKYIEISPPDFVGDGASLKIPVHSDANYALLSGKITISDKKQALSYDMNSRKLLDDTHGYKNPMFVDNGKYLLIYDLDGYSLSVYNSFSKVCEKNFETPIEYVYLDEHGGFAVITREKSYAGGVYAYNSNYKKIFSFMTRTASVTDICFDSKKKFLACATTDVKNGEFYSEIFTFDTDNDEEYKGHTEILGELPLSMFCTDDGFALVTEAGTYFFDHNAEKKSFYDFGYDTPDSVYRFPDMFSVKLKSSLGGNEGRVVSFGRKGEAVFDKAFENEIADISAGYGFLYVLCRDGIHIYSYDDEYTFVGNKTPDVSYMPEGEYKKIFACDKNEFLLITSSGAAKGNLYISDENTR